MYFYTIHIFASGDHPLLIDPVSKLYNAVLRDRRDPVLIDNAFIKLHCDLSLFNVDRLNSIHAAYKTSQRKRTLSAETGIYVKQSYFHGPPPLPQAGPAPSFQPLPCPDLDRRIQWRNSDDPVSC